MVHFDRPFQFKSRKTHDVYSPACSWAIKNEGIDCKNHSIFASSILINLGIKHYLRFVRYDEGSHVYVVIPKEQRIGKLEDNHVFNIDYYTIDGTSFNNNEQPFKFKFYDISPVQFKKKSLKRIGLITFSIALLIAYVKKSNRE